MVRLITNARACCFLLNLLIMAWFIALSLRTTQGIVLNFVDVLWENRGWPWKRKASPKGPEGSPCESFRSEPYATSWRAEVNHTSQLHSIRITSHITGSKKQSEERAELFTVRVHAIVRFHSTWMQPTALHHGETFQKRHQGLPSQNAPGRPCASVRQDKPGQSCELKRVHHENCLYVM
jgi:hypothetical protein